MEFRLRCYNFRTYIIWLNVFLSIKILIYVCVVYLFMEQFLTIKEGGLYGVIALAQRDENAADISTCLSDSRIFHFLKNDDDSLRYILPKQIENVLPRRYIVGKPATDGFVCSLNTCDPLYPDEVLLYVNGSRTIVGLGVGTEEGVLRQQLEKLIYLTSSDILDVNEFREKNFFEEYMRCLSWEIDEYKDKFSNPLQLDLF